MKSIKMALLGGAALAVTAAGAQADDLEALKAQIEALNQRVASMEAAPAIPAGYQLLTISEGEMREVPGNPSSAQDIRRAGTRATVISVLPTADAPAGASIVWSGYARAGLVYTDSSGDLDVKFDEVRDAEDIGFDRNDLDISEDGSAEFSASRDSDDLDVYARGRLQVVAATDTAVGEVGVKIRFEANFDGNGAQELTSDIAWGWWAMTPELTFGGGYDDTLGNIGYGYDGACTCYYTDTADLAFNPGDTTQMRLTYASGPFSMAVALEDGSFNDGDTNDDKLGVAGEIKYSGDTFSGEIAGTWRGVEEDDYFDVETNWQVGAGVGFSLGDIASISIAAAMGEGPTDQFDEGNLVDNGVANQFNNKWWGVTALASIGLTDEIHAEIAGGYKNREGDDFSIVAGGDDWETDGFEYETWGVLGGLYYTPVDQLTIGIEGEWYTTSSELEFTEVQWGPPQDTIDIEADVDTFVAAFVGVWRF
jgi:hypothetical protein